MKLIHMVFATEGLLEGAVDSWPQSDLNPPPLNSIQTLQPNELSGHWIQLAFRANLVQLLQFHLYVQCSRFILAFAFVHRRVCFKRTLAQVIVAESFVATESFSAYGIQHWQIFRSSYRKIIWLGFEPITTKFHSDAITDWDIRPVSWILSQTQLCSATPISSLCSVFTILFGISLRFLPHLL